MNIDHVDEHEAPTLPKTRNLMRWTYPLGGGVLAEFRLPVDITREEFNRIVAHLESIVSAVEAWDKS